jgi:hypothetical protein
MNRNEFMEYIRDNFNVDGATQRLINNILYFVENNYSDENEQYKVLCELLDGTIGLTDNEIKEVYL